MRTSLIAWILWLLTAVCVPAFAQEDEDPLFGEEPAAEQPADEAPAKETPAEEPTTESGDDLFGEPETPSEKPAAEKAPADEPKSESGDDLFGEPEAPADEAAPAAEEEKPEPPAREPHSHEEIIVELRKQNVSIAEQINKFLELNKQVFNQAIKTGSKEEWMTILREYGPAVIHTKQLWTVVVGDPKKYDTWLGTEENRKAWARFHASWSSLYGYTDRFAAIDMNVANKVSDGMAALGTSFDDYNAWVDEWDEEIGNDARAFARGDDRLSEAGEEEMREEEGADFETEEAAADQAREEKDETAPSEVEEAQEATEKTDEEVLTGEEESAEAAAEEEEMQEEEAIEGEGETSEEAPAEEAPVEEAPTEEAPAEDEPAENEIDFGEG